MKKILILLFFLLPLTNFAQDFSQAEADRFLEKLAQERSDISGVEKRFREEKQMAMMSRPVVSTGILSFQSPDKFRRETDGENKSLTISDGATLWIYYPTMKQAEFYSLKGRSPVRDSISAMVAGLNFKDVKRNFRYTMRKAGDGWEISLEPKNSALRRIFRQLTILLNSQRRVSKMEMAGESGDKTVTTFEDEKERHFPEGHFTFTPPAGVEVSKPLGN